MKKVLSLVVVFLLLSVGVHALTIESVSIAQTEGVTASYFTYDETTGEATLNWSGGASGLVLTDSWQSALFNNVEMTAQFTGMSDLSSGNIAKAQFTSGTWEMVLGTSNPGGPAVTLGGGLSTPYVEQELEDGDALDGLAIVTVTTSIFDFGYFGSLWGLDPIQVQWGDGNGLGGLVSSILFPTNGGIDNYSSDYLSENVTVTLLADEGSIPEPATLALLGLGGLLLRRRKA